MYIRHAGSDIQHMQESACKQDTLIYNLHISMVTRLPSSQWWKIPSTGSPYWLVYGYQPVQWQNLTIFCRSPNFFTAEWQLFEIHLHLKFILQHWYLPSIIQFWWTNYCYITIVVVLESGFGLETGLETSSSRSWPWSQTRVWRDLVKWTRTLRTRGFGPRPSRVLSRCFDYFFTVNSFENHRTAITSVHILLLWAY